MHILLPVFAICVLPKATVHQGMLYLATGEYWGYDTIRMPSIYWAILKVTDDLCKLSRKDHGLVASQDGLALAYPVIAARKEGGALLAFSYSGKGSIAGGQYPAYAGKLEKMDNSAERHTRCFHRSHVICNLQPHSWLTCFESFWRQLHMSPPHPTPTPPLFTFPL